MNIKFFLLPILLLSLLIFLTSCDTPETTSQSEVSTSYNIWKETSPAISTTAAKINNDINDNDNENKTTYVLNINSKKIHYADCPSVYNMKEENKSFTNDYEEAIGQGYVPCKRCNP